MAKNQAFRGIKLLYIFLTVTPTDSACFAWGVDLTKRLDILVGFLSRLVGTTAHRTRSPSKYSFLLFKNAFFLHYFKIIGTLCFVTTIDIQRKFLFKIRWIKENYLTNKNGRTCQFLQVSRLWKCTITSYYH